MSSYTREEYIDNLLGRSGGNSKFHDEQLLYLNDMNNGNYSNPLRFSTKSWTDDWMLYPEMYVNIPFIAEGEGKTSAFVTAGFMTVDAGKKYTGKPADVFDKVKITNKNGLYSLINSLIVKLNGNTVQNSTELHLSNHFRAITKWSNDYASSTGTLHNFSKDTAALNDASNLGFQERASISNYKIDIVQGPPVGGVDAAAYNEALCKITVQFEVNISLTIVSDFFNQLGMPLKNANFELSIGINGLDKISGNAQEWDGLAIDNVMATALLGGSQKMTLKIGGISPNCKLWCNKVIFMPNDALELDAMLNKEGGMQKTIVWDDAQVVQNTHKSQETKLDMTVSQNIRRPLKVVSFFLPVAYVGGVEVSTKKEQHMAYPCVTNAGIRHELYGDATPLGVGIVNANLRVDGKKLFEENIDSPYQFYQMFRDQTVAASDDKQLGSLVSYKEFQKLYNYYVFDLTKTSYKITDKPVVIEFLATKVNPANRTELFHIVTTESLTVLNFVDNNISTTSVAAN